MTLPLNADASGTSTSHQTFLQRLDSVRKELFSWRVLGGIFAALLVVGWIFIVIVLIQEEKWQLVLIAWLLLYSAAHFCYWYFKKHNLLPMGGQFCRRSRDQRNSVRHLSKNLDLPPTYDDVIKSEHPPPTYWSIVVDSPKHTHKTNSKFSLFSIESLPSVFNKSRPNSSKDERPPSGTISTISGSLPPYPTADIPPTVIDIEPHVFRNTSSRSHRSSLVRRGSMAIPITGNSSTLAGYSNGYPNSPENPDAVPSTSHPQIESGKRKRSLQSANSSHNHVI